VKPALKLSPRMDDAEAIACCDFPACRGTCCVYGVWVGLEEMSRILAHADLILPHLPPEAQQPDAWFTEEEEADPHVPCGRVRHTRVLQRPEHPLGSACIFWMPPQGRCALQAAAEAQGWHPWTLKPFYCILHPLDLDENGAITLDDVETLLQTPGGCIRPAEQARPLREIFAAELAWLRGLFQAGDEPSPENASRGEDAPQPRGPSLQSP